MPNPLPSSILYEKEFSREFAKKIMSPMPMIMRPSGPKEADRHWDYKARTDFDIIAPVEPKFGGHKASMIIVDEMTDIKEERWKSVYSAKYAKIVSERSRELLGGSFADMSGAVEDSVLTMGKLKKAMDTIGEDSMARKKIPKKKRVRNDPRKAKYNGRMFGNILLSTTEQISNNTTLIDALTLEGMNNTTVEELIVPLFDEFFQQHGDKWQVIGPMGLAAQSVETGKWKSVSALGGEILHYHSAVIGKRDGICIKWTTGNIVGLDEEMMIDTTVKSFGDKLVHAELGGNPANRATILDILLDFAGEADVVTAAEEAKERVRVAVAAELKEDIDRKSEAYGESFGSWA